MRAILAAICIALSCATPAAAQAPTIGPITLGMSPSEVTAVSTEASLDPSGNLNGATSLIGTVRLYGADFGMRAHFYWNTGLRVLALQHSGEEDEQTCAALVEASQREIERVFGVTPTFNLEQVGRWGGLSERSGIGREAVERKLVRRLDAEHSGWHAMVQHNHSCVGAATAST